MDDIYSRLGNIGRYQVLLWFLTFIPAFMFGVATISFAWTGFSPKVRCRLPFESENATYNSIFDEATPQQLTTWYPEDVAKKEIGQKMCSFCTKETVPCKVVNAKKCPDGLLYDHSIFESTLVEEYDMVCDNSYRKELIHFAYMFGVTMSNPIVGPLSDRFGRRPAQLIFGLTSIAFFSLQFILQGIGYVPLLFTNFVAGILANGSFLPSLISFMESSGGVPKLIGGMWLISNINWGYFFTVILAYYVRNWKTLLILYAIPSFLFIPYIWIYPESIRWAISARKEKLATKLVKKAASMNRLHGINDSMVHDAIKQSDQEQKRSNVLNLFTNGWPLARTTLIVAFTWFACSISYYGLAFNTTDLPGNVFTSFSLSVAVDLPSLLLSMLLAHYLGRKPSFVILLGIGGAACIGSGLITNSTIRLLLALTGKLSVAAAFALAYTYSTEIFPTVVRTSGTALGSASAHFGAMVAPLIHNLAYYVDDWLPIVIYGTVALIAASLDLLLPETKGKVITETIKEAVDINCETKARNVKSDLTHNCPNNK